MKRSFPDMKTSSPFPGVNFGSSSTNSSSSSSSTPSVFNFAGSSSSSSNTLSTFNFGSSSTNRSSSSSSTPSVFNFAGSSSSSSNTLRTFNFGSSSTNLNNINVSNFDSSSSSSNSPIIENNNLFNEDKLLYNMKINTNDGSLYVDRYTMISNSKVLYDLLSMSNVDYIDMLDFKKEDIIQWLKRFHKIPDIPLIKDPPTKNIGSYMMLCHKYLMLDLLTQANKSIKSLLSKDNKDLLIYMSKSNIFDEHLPVAVLWLIEYKLDSNFIESLSSSFIYNCMFTMIHIIDSKKN